MLPVLVGALWLSGVGCAVEGSLERSPCGAEGACVKGYTCCAFTNLCVHEHDVCVEPLDDHPVTVPEPTDDLTVFIVGQIVNESDYAGRGTTGEDLDMLVNIHPDVILRGWGQWQNYGISPMNFSAAFIERCHQGPHPILFLGGGTASALFMSQLDAALFSATVSRNVKNEPVLHDELNADEYRGSLAAPEFRNYLAHLADIQIQKGVDGLHYTELDADVLGKPVSGDPLVYDGNEGFDQWHLADFNAYLLEKYTDEQYTTLFQLPAMDRPRRDVPFNRLSDDRGPPNFNFRLYHDKANAALLAAWGHGEPDLAVPDPQSFLAWKGPYVYWPDLIKKIRVRVRENLERRPNTRPSKRFLITANGIFPHVDLIAKTFYDEELPGKANKELVFPRSPRDGKRHLDGETSRAPLFRDIWQQAHAVNPGVPVVVYLDGRWEAYHKDFSDEERQDFWRIFAAEAYAQGVFFAFSAKPPDVDVVPGFSDHHVRTASEDHTVDIFQKLSKFYGGHADIYHHVTALETAVEVEKITNVTVSVMGQEARDGHPARRFVHFINHNYVRVPEPNAGLEVQTNVKVSLPAAARPSGVRLATPDLAPDATGMFTPDVELPPSFEGGVLSFTLPRLEAYDVVTIAE